MRPAFSSGGFLKQSAAVLWTRLSTLTFYFIGDASFGSARGLQAQGRDRLGQTTDRSTDPFIRLPRHSDVGNSIKTVHAFGTSLKLFDMAQLRNALVREALLFLLAVQFLTRLPLPQDLGFSPTRLGAARRYFPLVGAAVGGLGALAYGAAALVQLPQVIAALLATAATILVTGAFHEDGLADTFDGLGAFNREKMLEIMQDSRIGIFGAVGLGMTLALKVAALASLPIALAMACLVVGHGLSRLSNVVVAATSPYIRTSGAGSLLVGRLSWGGTSLAAATGLGCLAVVSTISVPHALAGLAGLALGHLAMRGLYEKRLGGHTGDTQGAVQQWSELGLYLGILAWHSH